ncbi:LysR family transcriptional regulator [Pelomonas sp. KK5]|uniref:LysR family transcriptional regulator n=1 Tax=Pelomonas sp. KK5 TaxID=1855730 RepID=UPI00097BB7CC|nr:LysR family transcriptional regulator [Pelomonas sp. KK5]
MDDSLPGLREMQLFVAVYEERSFTAAATREFATQSGVSQHIKQMEDMLGVQLFRREKKSVEPTEAAAVFYARCLDVLAASKAALELREFKTGLAGEVRFGLTATLATHQLAPAYLRLSAQNPNASVAVIEARSDMLMDMVRANELDFAIIPAISKPPADLSSRVFAATPAFLVSSRSHDASGLCHGEAIGFEQLKGRKLLAPHSREHGQWIGAPKDLAAGSAPHYQLDAVLATLDLVRQSEWMAILPGLLFIHDIDTAPAEQDFCLNPFAGPGLTLELRVVRAPQTEPSALAQAAIDALRQVTEEHIERLRNFARLPSAT